MVREEGARSKPILEQPPTAHEEADKHSAGNETSNGMTDTIGYVSLLNTALDHARLLRDASVNTLAARTINPEATTNTYSDHDRQPARASDDSPATTPATTNELEYMCTAPKCSKRFSLVQEMQVHQTLHRTKQCPECLKIFSSYAGVRTHVENKICRYEE